MDIDTSYTDEIICPYCGHEMDHDSDDITLDGNYEVMYCNACEERFRYTTHHIYAFTSKKCDCLNGGECKWQYYYKFEDYTLYICKDCEKTERR